MLKNLYSYTIEYSLKLDKHGYVSRFFATKGDAKRWVDSEVNNLLGLGYWICNVSPIKTVSITSIAMDLRKNHCQRNNETDYDFCNRIIGCGWEYFDKKPSPILVKGIFYILFSPDTQRMKIGKAKDEKRLLSRLGERRRQCGNSFIMGVKYCDRPELEEKIWKDRFQEHSISRESFDMSQVPNLHSVLNDFIQNRNVIKANNIEQKIKDFIKWDGDTKNIPEWANH
jgi:hypothetical protein